MCPGCSAAGDLYTLQAKAAPPPAGAPPLPEALQLNKLDVNTPRVPDAARQQIGFQQIGSTCSRDATVAIRLNTANSDYVGRKYRDILGAALHPVFKCTG